MTLRAKNINIEAKEDMLLSSGGNTGQNVGKNFTQNISFVQDEEMKNSMEATYVLKYNYQKVEKNIQVTIERKDAKLNANKKESDTLIDHMMQRLGDALFPVTLIVTEKAGILDVKNYKEIFPRWYAVARSLLEEAYSTPVENYINQSVNNMADERIFIEAFRQQTFMQLLFIDSDTESIWFNVKNMTGSCSSDLVRCDKTGIKDGIVRFETIGDWGVECQFDYVFSETGDILSVGGYARKKLPGMDGYIAKNISLVANRRKIKKTGKFINFSMD